jgi:hypothetical protein
MKFRKATRGELEGTSLQGNLQADYDTLVDVFGIPRDGIDPYKVQVEWLIKFEDGTIASIHDWKSQVAPENVTRWSVGGESRMSYYYVFFTIWKDVPELLESSIKDIFEGRI